MNTSLHHRLRPALLRTLAAMSIAALSITAPAGPARAHGSLPISVRIMRTATSQTIYMPVFYWGIWVGDKAGPWKWICEEAINGDRFRHYAISTDGTIYATNLKSVSYSSQNGCQWAVTTGDIATLETKDVDVDPIDGATAWVAAGSDALDDGMGNRTPAANGLFVTHDHGVTFARAPGIGTSGRTFDSVRVAPTDGKIVYATSTDYNPPFAHVLHRSNDGGKTFAMAPMPTLPNRGDPTAVEILAIDPRDPTVVYLRANVTDGETDKKLQLLVRVANAGDAGQVADEIMSTEISILSGNWNSGINGLAFDLPNDQLFVATNLGVMKGPAALASQPLKLAAWGALSSALCIDVAGGSVFACASAFDPGSAAIMSGDATGTSLSPLFNFAGTVGPIDCPAGTSVHDICGPVWMTYAYQLGIGSDPNADGGTATDGGTMPQACGPNGCCCSLASHGDPPWPACFVLLAALALFRARRRRQRA